MPLPTSMYSPYYEPARWNRPIAVATNNCYSYAMNMPVNPLTGDPWGDPAVGYKPQPGVLSGLRLMQDGSNLCECVCADLAMCGRNIFERAFNFNAPIRNFCYRVYLVACMQVQVIQINGGLHGELMMLDYHWYIQNQQANSNEQFWSHKPGNTPATNVAPGSPDIIVDPTRINISFYNTRLGFLDVEQAGPLIFPDPDDPVQRPPTPVQPVAYSSAAAQAEAAARDKDDASTLVTLTYDELKQIEKNISYQELIKKLNEKTPVVPKSQGSGFMIFYYDWKDSNGISYTIAFNFLDNKKGLQSIYLIDAKDEYTFIF